jgi:hypothetical protein
MTLLDIELAGSTTRRRTELADDVAIEHLITSMITLVGDGSPAEGRWSVYRPGGERLASSVTLASAGVGHGDTLYVAQATPATDDDLADPLSRPFDDRTPSQRAATILPQRQTTRRRVFETVRALVGTRSILDTIDGTPLERMVGMWKWGDHRRRLDWIIARPQLERTITVGVCTQADAGASARLSLDLARSLAAARSDRVMLVDGDPVRAGVTRLATGRSQSITGVVDGSEVVDARFGADPVTILGCDLSSSDIPDFDAYRRTLDRIRPNAGVVVIDCGPVGSRLADLCEQIVLVTNGPIDHRVRRIFRHRPTIVAAAARHTIEMAVIDESLPTAIAAVELTDEMSAPEISAVLADSWVRQGRAFERKR